MRIPCGSRDASAAGAHLQQAQTNQARTESPLSQTKTETAGILRWILEPSERAKALFCRALYAVNSARPLGTISGGKALETAEARRSGLNRAPAALPCVEPN